MGYRTVKNITAIPQSIVFKGRQHVLLPLDEQNFEETVAQQFLAVCKAAVQDTTDEIGANYTLPSEASKYVWLANMTGNLDLPEKTSAIHCDDHGLPQQVESVNLMRQPRELKWELKGGHEQWVGSDGGLWQKSLPSTFVNLPAKRRIRVLKEVAEQVLSRDARAMIPGSVIKSREPGNFEPNMSWELDDMRSYLRLIDPSANPGYDQATYAKRASEQNTKLADLVTDAKRELLNRLYYRLVNPSYRMPTRAEFQEFVTGKPAEEAVSEDVQKLLEQSDKDSKRGLRKLNT